MQATVSKITSSSAALDRELEDLRKGLADIDEMCPAAAKAKFRTFTASGPMGGSTKEIMSMLAPSKSGTTSSLSFLNKGVSRKAVIPEGKDEDKEDEAVGGAAGQDDNAEMVRQLNEALAAQARQYDIVVSELEVRLEKITEEKEDSEFALQTRWHAAETARLKLEETVKDLTEQKEEVESRLQNVLSMKRTDLIKKYEDELSSLRAEHTANTELLATMKAEKLKTDTRLEEFRQRAEKAEAELKQRDEMERQKLAPTDERYVLKDTVSKQRDEIVLKSKAATAGWDAAADAEEKLEVAIDKAYQKGLKEGREQNKMTLKQMNDQLELKENRATELLEQFAGLNRRIAEMEKKEQASLAEIDELNVRIAMISARTDADDENLQNSLDAAQEEISSLVEKNEVLKAALKQSEKKANLYKELLEARDIHVDAGKGAKSGAGNAPIASQPAPPSTFSSPEQKQRHDIEEQLRIIAATISQVSSCSSYTHTGSLVRMIDRRDMTGFFALERRKERRMRRTVHPIHARYGSGYERRTLTEYAERRLNTEYGQGHFEHQGGGPDAKSHG